MGLPVLAAAPVIKAGGIPLVAKILAALGITGIAANELKKCESGSFEEQLALGEQFYHSE